MSTYHSTLWSARNVRNVELPDGGIAYSAEILYVGNPAGSVSNDGRGGADHLDLPSHYIPLWEADADAFTPPVGLDPWLTPPDLVQALLIEAEMAAA